MRWPILRGNRADAHRDAVKGAARPDSRRPVRAHQWFATPRRDRVATCKLKQGRSFASMCGTFDSALALLHDDSAVLLPACPEGADGRSSGSRLGPDARERRYTLDIRRGET